MKNQDFASAVINRWRYLFFNTVVVKMSVIQTLLSSLEALKRKKD